MLVSVNVLGLGYGPLYSYIINNDGLCTHVTALVVCYNVIFNQHY